ncbi:hypothetical protein AGR1B_Lc10900 [Agrobacterium fabacearum S56]|nr:hypothetical protein AGR1B_Lc10900 [Agrobacterium fabacearum S56]
MRHRHMSVMHLPFIVARFYDLAYLLA